ncbi:hypothetical protein OESDEN_18329 [Oesophagostomum dentatum]|uniref:Uncharacterized protein n=1 Tax=Oesophagostomum dentatum TaxID=61180 RepID=A0A0B1SFH9_OESDE|nr:hypothetical protein OESDEN_18329 [Oesophagostomum dentatum]
MIPEPLHLLQLDPVEEAHASISITAASHGPVEGSAPAISHTCGSTANLRVTSAVDRLLQRCGIHKPASTSVQTARSGSDKASARRIRIICRRTVRVLAGKFDR